MFFPQPPAGGELEDNLRSDGEHVMRSDTEDSAVPNLRQEFLQVEIIGLDSSRRPIIKTATFFLFD